VSVREEVTGMPHQARPRWRKAAVRGLVAGLLALLIGDGGLTATPPGIDPLEILDLQVKPNVLFILDSSDSMARTVDTNHRVSADDPQSRFYQAKLAIREMIRDNDGRANFGLASMHSALDKLDLNTNGPVVYVSTDANAVRWAGFFNNPSSNPGTYLDDTLSTNVFESFDSNSTSFDQPYPTGCTSGVDCRYYIKSRRFRNGVKFLWDTSVPFPQRDKGMLPPSPEPFACPVPPAGLLGDDTDAANDGAERRPCFAIEEASGGVPTGRVTVYYYSSGTFGMAAAGPLPGANECNQADVVVPVQQCGAASNAATILDKVKLSLPLDVATGNPVGFPTDPPAFDLLDDANSNPNFAGAGLRIGSGSPIVNALVAAQQHYQTVVFPARPAGVVGLQKNYVILITDSDPESGCNAPGAAVARAQAMYGLAAGDRIETLVVSYAAGAAVTTRLNALAAAGSDPLAPRTAFSANSPSELKGALAFAFADTIAAGSFSTESSITESIYEYVAAVPTPASPVPTPSPFSANEPDNRYGARIPVLLQTSFDMPGFRGHLKAFINADLTVNGVLKNATTAKWDAGDKLLRRVVDGIPVGTGMGAFSYDFDTIRGPSPIAPVFSPSGSRVQRRIFTTARNGVFPYGANGSASASQTPVPLWPPTDTVAPRDDVTSGSLDAGLGIAALTFNELRSQFGACLGTAGLVPAACTAAEPLRTQRARREAREMILAYTAGVDVVQGPDGLPQRGPGAAFNILYRARPWILAESTLAVPAVITPPLEAKPQIHTAEYQLFRDGPRQVPSGVATSSCPLGSGTCVDQGFGLRNPDKDGTVGSKGAGALKPVMSVVYHAANDMLHAFRAGPRVCTAANACPSSATEESGGEELWGFVPYDLLVRLKDRLNAQDRARHAYMVASSVRFVDVFVPDNDGYTVEGRTYAGRWRVVVIFGRGIAGKHYTALDVTSPGPFNRTALATNPPILLWNRGNPDTQDGLPPSGSNENYRTNNQVVPAPAASVDLGAVDVTQYAKMGETWSIPAIARVPTASNFNVEFAAFAGSGYSVNPAEGKTFYVMDALTGDILHAYDVPDATGPCGSPPCAAPPNALVAGPAAYIAQQLVTGFVGNPAASQASLVYIGDVHGRLWKFITSSPSRGLLKFKDMGVDQPIANPVALLNLSGKPHVYVEAGNDNRVSAPPNFRLWAFRDDAADTNAITNPDPDFAPCGGISTPGCEKLFRVDLGLPDTALDGYRGTAQPATAFNSSDPNTAQGRVFYIATKFTPGGAGCIPNFNSAFFALGARSGDAAYDLNAAGDDRYVLMTGQKINAVRGAGGQLVLDKGVLGSAPPAPPPPPAPYTGPQGGGGDVFVKRLQPSPAMCN
jgi:hypothetical protein